MTTSVEPSEHDIHAFVDGRLEPEQARVVEAWLLEHPERAAEIEGWQHDAQHLRAALGGSVDPREGIPDNPALDPGRLRDRRRARRRLQVAVAAGLVLCIGVGGVTGWQLRGWNDRFVPTMDDALEAHRLFAADGALNPDITPRDASEMQAWMDRHFVAAPKLPDLAGAGFHLVGARLLATNEGPAAMVLYRDGQGGVISFYMRPGSDRFHLPHGEHREGALVAQFQPVSRYWVAMVSVADGRDASIARRALPDSE